MVFRGGNPLAKACEISPHTGQQTMVRLLLQLVFLYTASGMQSTNSQSTAMIRQKHGY